MNEEYGLRDDIKVICTVGASAKKAFFYALEAGKTSDSRTCGIHQKNDEYLFYGCVTNGTGELHCGNDVHIIEKGDCFFTACSGSYSFNCYGDEPCGIMWIYFGGATSREYYDIFSVRSANVFRPSAFEKISNAITEIIRINEDKTEDSDVVTSGLIMQLLTIALTSENRIESVDSALKQKLQAVNLYIEEHFTEDISLEKLSAEFYISKYYLSREYKKVYGKTIFQHIIACRIAYGKQLLRFSDNSVEEIAHLCGFNDQSYFVRQFKKSENLTCFAYRRMWRE